MIRLPPSPSIFCHCKHIDHKAFCIWLMSVHNNVLRLNHDFFVKHYKHIFFLIFLYSFLHIFIHEEYLYIMSVYSTAFVDRQSSLFNEWTACFYSCAAQLILFLMDVFIFFSYDTNRRYVYMYTIYIHICSVLENKRPEWTSIARSPGSSLSIWNWYIMVAIKFGSLW